MKKMIFVCACFLLAGCSVKQSSDVPYVDVANETAVMVRLRQIAEAETFYQAESGEYATLEQLIEKGYVRDPKSGKLTGYRFEVRVRPRGFDATAVPEKVGVTGRRSFFVDETRVLRGADKGGKPATALDPEL